MSDWETLTVGEKSSALKVLIKNLEHAKFAAQQELGAEMSLSEPNETLVAEYTSQLAKHETKQQYYKDQLAALTEPEE